MSIIEERRRRVAEMAELTDEVLLVEAGEPIPIPGTDQHHHFRAHPDFRYLADASLPGATLAHDAATGEWELFAPEQTVDDRMWHGVLTQVGRPAGALDGWLAERAGRAIERLGGDGTAAESEASRRIETAVHEARVVKDADEVERMRRAATATAAGFEEVYRLAAPGMTERDIEAELEVGFRRGGGDTPAYDSIICAGRNAAVLHYSPSRRKVEAGEFVLIDAAAMVDGYACDVTRTFVVGGEPSQRQRDIHAIVTEAQAVGVSKCVPGQEYRQIHIETAIQMTAGLVELGLMRGDPNDLVARGAAAVFFPHGVGHLIGLSVHDVAGYAPGREPTATSGTRFLRADRQLVAGMVVTIEPGIYFIEAILDGADEFAADIDLDLARDYLGVGGVRVEDCIHVAVDGPENLTEGVRKILHP